MVKVLGVDPSVSSTGLALPNGALRTLLNKAGPDRTGERIRRLRNDFVTQLNTSLPQVAVIEGYGFSQKHGRTITTVAEVVGNFKYCLCIFECPFVEVPPTSLKQFATGKGNANKKEVIEAMKFLASEAPFDDNQADAWWLKRIGDYAYGNLRQDDLAEHQRDLIKRLNWPTIGGQNDGVNSIK